MTNTTETTSPFLGSFLPPVTFPNAEKSDAFFPKEPKTFEDLGLQIVDVEALALKQLLVSGPTVGRKIAEQLKIPFGIMQECMRGLKSQILVSYRSQAQMGDFEYELTPEGETRARWYSQKCTYCGAAPVLLKEYIDSVEQQSIRHFKPKLADLAAAFADLSLSPSMISQVGQAIYGGRALFLYGNPGNGKTSMAERVIRAVNQTIWIPRTITLTGEIIRLFDPASHEEVAPEGSGSILDMMHYDRRWVRIKRPSIIVGGELKLENLEITNNESTGIIESPLQLKSNGGALVVDDFGRQRMSTSELLNRWIIPLEKGHDYLSLPSGRQIQVPFDSMLVFSTNLEPKNLVDEAFLRRIPYKIEVVDPSPREFRELFKHWCSKLELEYKEEAFEHLFKRHFVEVNRPLRFCYPRDLLTQVKTFCQFHEFPPVLTEMAMDVVAKNYFAGL